MGENHKKPQQTPQAADATIVDGSTPGAASIPETIGPYQVKRIIGSGGMGTVVLAQQDNPRRDVAIKIMNPGVISRKALRRFEFEAQTLGRLQHSAIAQVYEAGTFDEGSGGRPYFAMEYVADATELVDYVTDQELDIKARLQLFRAICAGVEYGHQRGVIHRDLKPGNILVDAEGHPKIIDFGVARSTESDSVSATLATEAGQLIGTLQYMSPEQVDLDPAGLDTRSDVYALGVILYQLLVARLPYDLGSISLAKAAEFIRTAQPARLSEINPAFKGDLETICLKALEKDRERRYQSVGDLSEDLHRYLNDESIMARPPTRGEQLSRLIRKNKAVSIATAVVALSLVAATIISIIFATEAVRQRDAAELARENAEELAEVQLTQLASFDLSKMGDSLRSRMMDELQLDAAGVAEVDFTGAAMDLMREHFYEPTLEEIKEALAGQPLVQARMLQTLASVMVKAGLYQAAFEPQAMALELRIEELGKAHEDSIKSLTSTGYLYFELAQNDKAKAHLEDAIELSRQLYGKEHQLYINSIGVMGFFIQFGLKDVAAATPYYEETLRLTRKVHGDDHRDTLSALGNMGANYQERGMYQEALTIYMESLDSTVGKFGEEDFLSLAIMDAIGGNLTVQGRYQEADEYLVKCLASRRRLLGDQHSDTLNTTGKLADLRFQEGKFQEAVAHMTAALNGASESLGESHPRSVIYLQLLILYHQQWHEAEPDAGHDATAAQYRAQLDDLQQKDAAAPKPTVP